MPLRRLMLKPAEPPVPEPRCLPGTDLEVRRADPSNILDKMATIIRPILYKKKLRLIDTNNTSKSTHINIQPQFCLGSKSRRFLLHPDPPQTRGGTLPFSRQACSTQKPGRAAEYRTCAPSHLCQPRWAVFSAGFPTW